MIMFFMNAVIAQEKAKVVLELDVIKLTIFTFQNEENSLHSCIELENISDYQIGIDTHYINKIINEDRAIINIGGIDPSYHNPVTYLSINQNEKYDLLFDFPRKVKCLHVNLILESDLLFLRSELFRRKIDYEINFGLDGQYQVIFDVDNIFKTKSLKNYRISSIPVDNNSLDSIKVMINGSIFNKKRR
jgi:hypothetical protein